MIEKLISTYNAFFLVIGIAFDTPSAFYRRVVKEVDLRALIGFLVQVMIAVSVFNSIVFANPSTDNNNTFDEFYFVLGAFDLFIGASVFTLVFWGALRLVREPAVFSEIAKFTFVVFIAVQILTLITSTIITYIGYNVSNGYAYMSSGSTPPPLAVEILDAIDHFVMPTALGLFVVGLVFASTGRSFRVIGCFAVASCVHVFLVGSVLNNLWLNILMMRFGTH